MQDLTFIVALYLYFFPLDLQHWHSLHTISYVWQIFRTKPNCILYLLSDIAWAVKNFERYLISMLHINNTFVTPKIIRMLYLYLIFSFSLKIIGEHGNIFGFLNILGFKKRDRDGFEGLSIQLSQELVLFITISEKYFLGGIYFFGWFELEDQSWFCVP